MSGLALGAAAQDAITSQAALSFRVRLVRLGEAEQVVESEWQAKDATSLKAQLRSQGWVVLSAHPVRPPDRSGRRHGGWRGLLPKGHRAPDREQYAVLCRELRTLLSAGMTVVEAIDTLHARQSGAAASRNAARLLTSLCTRLREGSSLSAALASLPGVPPVLVAAVRAGERTSDLVVSLEDYLRFDALVTRLRRAVVSAAIYPALVSALGVGICGFLLTVVMPNFARMYENLRGGASGLTAWMIHLSLFVNSHRGATLGAAIAFLAGTAWWITSGLAQSSMLSLLRRNAWTRTRVDDFYRAMLYQALALLLRGGYPMTEALGVVTSTALSVQTAQALRAASLQVEAGRSVSLALSEVGLVDEVGRRLLAAAERNGDFHAAAQVVAGIHAERFEIFIERATRIVEPVLLLGVALMVGAVVVMMYLPVFDLATRVR